MKQEIPEVEARAVLRRGERTWRLIILCPLCGKEHSHGGGREMVPGRYGHRTSHCFYIPGNISVENDRGYILIPHKTIQPLNENGPHDGKEAVYFIQAGNKIKIGRARDVAQRLRTMQIGCPDELKLIAAIPYDNCIKAEKEWHEDFAEFRIRGEWFQISAAKMRAAIKER